MITSNLERYIYGYNKTYKNYQIFLDESNNIGNLKHYPNHNNRIFNKIIQNGNIPPIFVLGGVAKHENKELVEPNWKNKLKLQSDELKFRNIGKNFFNRLGSCELKEVLTWIKANEIFIHFSLFDWIYFYNVDIIDSFLDDKKVIEYLTSSMLRGWVESKLRYYKKYVGLDTKEDLVIYIYLLKDLMHQFMIENLKWFLSEIYNNHYKKIDEKNTPIFLENLYQKIKKCSDEKYNILASFLGVIDRTRDLVFIYDEIDSQMNSEKDLIVLTKNMSAPYQNYIDTFPKSTLYFDNGVENMFLDSQKKATKIFFEESKNNSIIQASDVICGLFAGIGEQIQKFNEEDFTKEVIGKFKSNHEENLKILADIYFQSESESNGLFTHFFVPMTFAKRFQNFIHLYK